MSKKRNVKKNKKDHRLKEVCNLRPPRKKITSNNAHLVLYKYTVTTEPINLIKIPPEIEEEVEEIFYKVHEKPGEIIDRLEILIKEYPSVPLLYNYLAIAYSKIGNKEKAEETTENNYKENPNYLFAKLNYAEICIQKGELEKMPEIFDNKFELKALYPKRNKFHITEAVGFWGVIGIYFALRGYTDQAQLYYKNLKELAPEHPFTQKLGMQLMFSS